MKKYVLYIEKVYFDEYNTFLEAVKVALSLHKNFKIVKYENN